MVEEYSKYEQARMIGARALQISMGAPLKIALSDEELKKIGYNTIELAKLEFQQGLIEMTIKRPSPLSMKKEVQAKPFDQTKLE